MKDEQGRRCTYGVLLPSMLVKQTHIQARFLKPGKISHILCTKLNRYVRHKSMFRCRRGSEPLVLASSGVFQLKQTSIGFVCLHDA